MRIVSLPDTIVFGNRQDHTKQFIAVIIDQATAQGLQCS